MRWFLVCVARIKNEAPYLREWLEYHFLVGVDHFYLYDMDDTEETEALLRPYEKRGRVTRIPWAHFEGTKWDRPQSHFSWNKSGMAHQHFCRTFRRQAVWAQKIDGDEFLYPLEGDSVAEALRRYDPARVRGLSLPRYNFGDQGHLARPPGLVIESYLRREAHWSSYKDAGSTRYISRNLFNPCPHAWHYHLFSPRRIPRDEVQGLRLNHYFSKSFEEFVTRQNTNKTRQHNRETFEFRNRLSNEVPDDGMLRFAPAVRRALAT